MTNPGDRRRLRFITHTAEWLAVAGVAMGLGYIAYLALAPDALAIALRREVPGVVVDPGGPALTAAGLVSLIPALIFIAAMWSARTLFRLLGRAATVFDPAAPSLLRRIGLLAVAAAVAGVVVRMTVGLLMTSANPPGQQQLVLSVSSGDVTALLVGLLMLAFALVMREGIRLDEDNRSIL
ncbi:DUF2975 domain-containing protein [Reyranella sp.]|uniref:DUF2975 domain-containing protein n=1 Tax=Reyranella sp. TaxID=1929291 RepID=UPI0025F22EA9|nr:DUF2975 domain-containing protein [Reyranella sp.]